MYYHNELELQHCEMHGGLRANNWHSSLFGCSIKRWNCRRARVIVSLVLLPLSGCATIKPIPVRPLEDYPNRMSISEVSVAVEAFHAPQTAKVFNHRINDKGFLPVLLVIRNDGDDPIAVNAGEITLRPAQGQIRRRIPARVLAGRFERSAGAEAVLLFGIFSFMDANQANDKLHADWQDKELAKRILLQPHSTAYGFTYFELAKREQQNKMTLTVPVLCGEYKNKETLFELAVGSAG